MTADTPLLRPGRRRGARVVLFLFFLTAVLTLAAGEAAPSPIPDTPAGKRFADLMRLAESGDEREIAAYVEAQFTPSMQRKTVGDPGIVPFLVDHAARFRGFEVARVLASTDDHLTALVRPRTQADRWLRYVLKVEPAPPHRIEGLFLMPAEPDDIPRDAPPLPPDEAIAAFTREVERVVTRGFSGVVLLAQGDRIVLHRAAGEADREHHVAVKPDTVFGLASMNKMFTAVAVARLVEEGRVRWSDPVGRHLPGWLADDAAASITIDELLTHRAGLGDYLGRVQTDPTIRNARSLGAYRELVRSTPIEPPAEGRMQYSNTGYVVLGALIEAVSGRDYFDFVRDEIYARAGMTHTASWSMDEVIDDRATGYLTPAESAAAGLGRGWHSNVALLGVRGTSAGGGWSTAADLFRFARALVEGRLVKPETLGALVEPRVRFPVGGHYGYGFVVHETSEGQRVFGHAGGTSGVNGELKIYGDGAYTLVVLSNASGGAGELVGSWDGLVARVR